MEAKGNLCSKNTAKMAILNSRARQKNMKGQYVGLEVRVGLSYVYTTCASREVLFDTKCEDL